MFVISVDMKLICG